MNNLYCIEKIFNLFSVYIPNISLIQRNYVWDKQNILNLYNDFLNNYYENKDYTIGLGIFFKDDKKIDIIDSQQRFISIYIILSCLNYTPKFKFNFERDEQVNTIKRSDYLFNINSYQNDNTIYLYPDIKKFYENFKFILEHSNKLDLFTKNNFIKYILKKVYILVYFTKLNIYDEFININEHKTNFTIFDKVKSTIFINISNNNIDTYINKFNLLYSDISDILYKNEYQIISNLIKQKYKYENRLDIIYINRFNNDYDLKKFDNIIYEYNYLIFIKKILLELINDNKEKKYDNYNIIYILILYKNLNFFEIINYYINNNIDFNNYNRKKKYLKNIIDFYINSNNISHKIKLIIKNTLIYNKIVNYDFLEKLDINIENYLKKINFKEE